jgi:hypothetical protein
MTIPFCGRVIFVLGRFVAFLAFREPVLLSLVFLGKK